MRAKKKLKKPVIVIALLIVVIAAGAFIGYQLIFENIDPDEKAAINQEMDDITKDILESISDSMNPSLADVEGVGDNPGNSNEEAVADTGNDINENKKVLKVIKVYESGFSKLEEEGNAIVARLLSGAKNDYKLMKESGAGKIELAKLATSYTNRSKAMEDVMDSSVDMLSSRMKDDLIDSGMDQQKAKEYIDKLKDTYKKQKEEKRKSLLTKAKEFL